MPYALCPMPYASRTSSFWERLYITLKFTTANNNSLVLLIKLDGQCVWDRDRNAARNILSWENA
jgi:hypothetical protein